MIHKSLCVHYINWDAHNTTLKIKVPKVVSNNWGSQPHMIKSGWISHNTRILTTVTNEDKRIHSFPELSLYKFCYFVIKPQGAGICLKKSGLLLPSYNIFTGTKAYRTHHVKCP